MKLKYFILGLLSACLLSSAYALQISGVQTLGRNQVVQMGIPAISREVGITATPTPALATAYQLTAGISQVTTIGTTGDAVKLPSTNPFGANNVPYALNVIVVNSHATNAVAIFPFLSTDTIAIATNGGTPGASISLAALKSAECFATADGLWYCQIN